MPRVQVQGHGFSMPFLNLNGEWEESWGLPSVVLAAMFVGRRPRDRFRFGLRSLAELTARAGVIYANLAIADNRFVRSRVYETADPTEKGRVSYALGQSFMHLFMTSSLGVRYTLHVDVYVHTLGVAWRDDFGRRPDLLGLARGWIVAEAKGRSWWLDSRALREASAQKAAISSIQGRPPVAAVASAVHFSRGSLALAVTDPEFSDRVDLPIDQLSFVRAFYAPFLEAIGQGDRGTLFGRDVWLREIPNLDLLLAVDVGVAEALSSEPSLISLIERVTGAPPQPIEDEYRILGVQGIGLELGPSWTSQSLSGRGRHTQPPSKVEHSESRNWPPEHPGDREPP
jgi:hypothetical protein